MRNTTFHCRGAGSLLGEQEPGSLCADAAGKIATAAKEQSTVCNYWSSFLVGGPSGGSGSDYVLFGTGDYAADHNFRRRNSRGSWAATLSREIHSLERDHPSDVQHAGARESYSKYGIIYAGCDGGTRQCGSDAGQRSGDGEAEDAARNS